MPLHLQTLSLVEAESALPALRELVAWRNALPPESGAVRLVSPAGSLGLNSELMLVALPAQYESELEDLVTADLTIHTALPAQLNCAAALKLQSTAATLLADVDVLGTLPNTRHAELLYIGIASGDMFVVAEHHISQVWLDWVCWQTDRARKICAPALPPSGRCSAGEIVGSAAANTESDRRCEPTHPFVCQLTSWQPSHPPASKREREWLSKSRDGSYTTCSDELVVDERNRLLHNTTQPGQSSASRPDATVLTTLDRNPDSWEAVRHFASQHPDTVVLCSDGFRFARREADALATAMRAELLYCVASGSLQHIHSIGTDATTQLCTVASTWVNFVRMFRVEDTNSLESLLELCATELALLADDAGGTLAKAYLPKALRRGWRSGTALLARQAGADAGLETPQLPRALRIKSTS